MSWQNSIRKSIRDIAGSSAFKDKPDVYYASVDGVDEAARTCSCTLINGTSDISLEVVNLMAEVNDGLLRIPTIGSTVYILSTPNIKPFVDVFSELDKIFYVAGGSTFLIADSGIELMGKKYGGIPEVEVLTNKIVTLEKLVNALNDNWNQFASTYVAGSPTTIGLPAAINIPPFTTNSDISPLTQRSDLENTKVQHGDGS